MFIDHPEQAERYLRLRDASAAAGHELVAAGDHGLDPILAVHAPDYLDFLQTAWSRRGEMPGTVDEILTGHFARPQMHRRPVGMLGLIGLYTGRPLDPDPGRDLGGDLRNGAGRRRCRRRGAR